MKNTIVKLLSSLLILSFLASTLSVLTFALVGESAVPEKEEVTDNEEFICFINRDFQEGWGPKNGFSKISSAAGAVYIDRETDVLSRYNYFVRFEATSDAAASARFEIGTNAVTHATKDSIRGTTVEFSLKADDASALGNILSMVTGVRGQTIKMLDIKKDGVLVAFDGVAGGNKEIGKLENEWINIAYVFDWQNRTNLSCTIWLGYGLGNGYSEKIVLDQMEYTVDGDVGAKYFDFGFPKSNTRADTANSIGMSYCLDNLKIYQGAKSIVDIPDTQGYGVRVDPLAAIEVDIQEYAGAKTKVELLEEALAMKLGVEYALIKNQRYPLINNAENDNYSGKYGAPVKQGNEVLVSLQLILDYIGFPAYVHPDNMSFDITTGSSTTYISLGRDTATVDGERIDLSVAPGYIKNTAGEDYLVIAVDDIPLLFPGWLVVYDEMGLVLLYEDTTPENLEDNAPIVTREEDLSTMIDIMKKFVFDNVELGYVEHGEAILQDTKDNTSDFAHPYIIANADVFTKLRDKYNLATGANGYDKDLKAYIQSIIAQADAYYTEYAQDAGVAYAGIKAGKEPVSTYGGDGYNSKGEMTELVNYAKILPTLAFAYQITGNAKYAKLAYDWSVVLGQWEHWGPAYFTHCAEVTSSIAISYDWLYNAYKSLSLDTDVIANAIYELGVHDGYVSSSGGICEHARAQGDLSVYNDKFDSSNAVSTSGMVIGSLAILDYVSGANAPEAAYNETVYLLGNNMQSLVKYGLDIYAPDGSYIESATYWEYAASNLFRMIMALVSATGDDYGLMNTWGIDTTCYYAIHIESSDGFIWNYHDSGAKNLATGHYNPSELATLTTDMFNFVGTYLGDATLLAVRQHQLKNGRAATIYDLLFYPFDGIEKAPELTLDYHMEAIDGYVARSDWESGAIYTGIMGGANDTNRGHLDSGNFIYHNKGIAWAIDLGTENPYVERYNVSSMRYKYYRASAEGQNVVIMPDHANIPYGQAPTGNGFISKTYTNEHGSYAILDNTSAYLTTVTYAKRGVMMTNDRSTVVLQDEVSFVTVQSVAWLMHTSAFVTISEDGRVAYLTQSDSKGITHTVRATIVSPRPDFTFVQRPITNHILGNTLSKNQITGESEYSYTGITRLAIEGVTISFDVAVVFEYIENFDNEQPVGYKYTSLAEWEPSAPSSGEEGEEVTNIRATAKNTDIITETAKAKNILKKESTAFTTKLDELYKALANVEYTLKTFPPKTLQTSALANAYSDYKKCVKDFEKFENYLNGAVEDLGALSQKLSGIADLEN